ncbi:conserved protein, unknown function [Plasmodium ovale wallikeri]|uniref:DUF2423 domain-containing protein n=2 Tax=Plasmodium ovale TaxID=36330 RepID=A0A1A9AJY3_PLAOA|nr:conserved protein, unknown function [Plasmodium ovale wallikeri]SBT56499.1 conserved protein, unknown function [Plasmodium ovale wallikeri]SBT76325.1 conserved protein, unknown function [Plasmodium ovale]
MAKGLRSKVKRRFRTVKRMHVNEIIEKPNVIKLNKRIKLMLNNKKVYKDLIKPPNKFLHPDDEKAVIPQHKIAKHIDFRSEALPLSGFATIGNRRKYKLTEKMEIKNLYGNSIGLNDDNDISKLIEDMHKRSEEVMKAINENGGKE